MIIKMRHKYFDDGDIIYDEEDRTVFYVHRDSSFYRSKFRYYSKINELYEEIPARKKPKTLLVTYHKEECFSIVDDTFNFNDLELSLSPIMWNVDKFLNDNVIKNQPIVKKWVDDIREVFLNVGIGNDIKIPYGGVGDLFLKYLEVWRRIFDGDELLSIARKNRIEMPDHLKIKGTQVPMGRPQFDVKDFECIHIKSSFRVSYFIHSKLLWNYRIAYINMTTGLKEMKIGENEFVYVPNTKLKQLVIVGKQIPVNETYKTLIKIGVHRTMLYTKIEE